MARLIACFLVLAPLAGQVAAQNWKKELAAFFKEIDDGYPFFKVKGIAKDWTATKKRLSARVKKCRSESEFFDIVVAAARCLRDGHLRLSDNKLNVENKSERSYYPGFAFLPATKGRVSVMAAPSEHAAKMPPGTVITKIDGRPARAFLDERGKAEWRAGGFFSSPQRATFFEYRLPLSGKRGTKHTIEFLDGKSLRGKKRKKRTVRATYEVKGWLHNYHQPELTKSARSIYHCAIDRNGDAYGYVWFRRLDRTAEEGFRKAIEAHPNARGWIVDLRGNTGGGYSSKMRGLIGKLQRPVTALIDAGCVSAGETLTRDLVRHAKARTFGATTAGSSSTKKTWRFPCGKLSVRYSTGTRRGIEKPIEFWGIEPDVATEAVPEELAAGKNSTLERALEFLRKQR